jgi:flagellin-like protein
MRSLLRERRGISPIFSTVLLILLVVGGMSFAFAFLVNYVKDYQIGRGSSVLELVCIEDVWFREVEANAPIEIWLYNYGKVDVNVKDLYVNGKAHIFNLPDESITIRVGEHGKIITTELFVTSTTAYHLRVVTARGSVFEGEYVSPS